MNHIASTKEKGILFVLSGPSGAGKTTVASILLDKIEGLQRSISHTTRAKRDGEKDGVDYFFVDENEFKEMVSLDEFIEWANVHGSLYGTSLKTIKRITENEREDILLVIDTQGAQTLGDRGTGRRTIFLMPPSMEELRERLVKRGSDSNEAQGKRLANAIDEIGERSKFDYIVINDNLDKAVSELYSIIIAERLKTENTSVTFEN